MIKKFFFKSALLSLGLTASAQTITADFENLILAENSYWNSGVNTTDTSFVSGDASFHNTNDGWWSKGWAYSNVKDSTTEGYTNQYAAFPESGANNSSNYAIGRNNAKVVLLNESKGSLVQGVYITNSTYAALSMQNGDMFAKKFGGVSGDDEDFFLLTIKKYYNGVLSTDSINFYLADFRFEDNSEDYIVKDWTFVNLESLGVADSLAFSLSSSDVGGFGMNTPSYFAIDELITNQQPSNTKSLASNKAVIKLYPNPATSNITVDLSEIDINKFDNNSTLEIISIDGKVLNKINNLNTVNNINISELSTGIYYVRILIGDEYSISTFIKK